MVSRSKRGNQISGIIFDCPRKGTGLRMIDLRRDVIAPPALSHNQAKVNSQQAGKPQRPTRYHSHATESCYRMATPYGPFC